MRTAEECLDVIADAYNCPDVAITESLQMILDEAVAHGMTLAATNKIHFEIHSRRLMESERAFAERNVQMFRKAIIAARDNKVWRTKE